MPEAGLDEWESWKCARDTEKFCPPEGCPKNYGCARDHGWTPGMPSPDGCSGRRHPPVEIVKTSLHAEAVVVLGLFIGLACIVSRLAALIGGWHG